MAATLMTPRQKLAAGRLLLKDDSRAPYLSAAIDALVPVEMAGLDTVGVTDNGILMWDPKRMDEWSVDEIATVLEHEVWHVLRKHTERCKAGAFDRRLFNMAADCEINDDLVVAGRHLPKFQDKNNPNEPGEPCLPKLFGLKDGKTAEEYYAELRKKGKEALEKLCKELGIDPDQLVGGGGEGDGEGQEGEGKKPQPKVGRGWCGSGAGRALPKEPPKDGPDKVEGRTPAEMGQVRAQVAEAIRSKAQKGRGNIPADLARWANEELKPAKVPWQQKLARAARNSMAFRPGAQDYHYGRSSRRQSAVGYGLGHPVLPAMREPVPDVMVCVDTSGSMGADELNTCLAETAGILKATTAKVRFMAVDCAVPAEPVKEIRRWVDAARLLRGGGGTDFRVPFRMLKTMKERPDVLIYLTDGMGPCPVKAPDRVNVIWLLVGPSQQLPYMSPESDEEGNKQAGPLNWGHVIHVRPDGAEETP